MKRPLNDSLTAMLYPRGVAVVGSVSPGKLGEVLAHRILAGGYENVYSVNPKAQGVDGKAGYALLTDVQQPIDLAIFACPAKTVPDMMLNAGKAGVKAAVVISSGFSEAGQPALEAALQQAAETAGIRYVGPNCAGILNTVNGLVATLEVAPSAGRASLLSQSGAIGGAFMNAANEAGLGMGKFLSYGNGSDLRDTDLLNYLADDPDTDVICMYIENVKNGRGFLEALSAATAKKPVVVIKSGRTAGGARAARSHTGSMAGADEVYDAAFRKCGAIRAASLEEMIDLAKSLAASVSAQKTGKRMGILTNSGGPGVLTADRCEELGLTVPAPGEELVQTLKSFLPGFAGFSNPIDVTVEGTAEQYGDALTHMLSFYDGAVVIYVGTPYLAALPVAKAIAEAREKANKPVAAYFAVGADIDEAKAYLTAHNVPCYPSGERAAAGLHSVLRPGSAAGLLTLPDETAPTVTLPAGQSALVEPEAMAVLDSVGIPTPEHFVAHSGEEAVAFAKKLGYPVCMKIVSRDILHKSDVGGVALNVSSDQAAADTYARLAAICQGKDFSGVILYPMLKKGVEVIMGLVRDPTFGPVCVFGLGGIFTEILKDVTMAVAPLSKEEAKGMIASVKAYKLLTGARGSKGCDIDALADMLVKLSQLLFRYPEIREVDLNPVMAYEKGALAADARMIL